jgi:predicted DNA-binding ribbon-helix-helix protein
MPISIERVQTGVRLEKRMLKVLKALAEDLDMSLGELLEGVVLHAFEGLTPFSHQTLAQVERLRAVYGLELHAADSHTLIEREESEGAAHG